VTTLVVNGKPNMLRSKLFKAIVSTANAVCGMDVKQEVKVKVKLSLCF
jgi:hypothetical protein